MEKLEELNRLVQTLKEEPPCIDDAIKKVPTGIKSQLLCTKQDNAQYKCTLLHKEPKLKLLEIMQTESPSLTLSDAKAEAQRARDQKKVLAERTDELTCSLADCADQLPALRESLANSIAELDQAMQETSQQAIIFAKRKEELKAVVNENIQKKEASVAQCEEKRRQLDARIVSAETRLASLK